MFYPRILSRCLLLRTHKEQEISAALRRSYCNPLGTPGTGAGRGGGAGGSVRDSGGAFGERAARQEEGYFHKKTQEELRQLKEKMDKESAKSKDKENKKLYDK